MSREYHRVLLLFVDGVGLAPAGPDNPLSRWATPTIDRLLGGSLTTERLGLGERSQLGDQVLLGALDATLGVPGLPQSATGQTALFAGVNGAARLGRHMTGFPGPSLRPLIEEGSIFRRATERGLAATFANAYSGRYLEALAAGEARASVTTRAVAAARLEFRTVEDLLAGKAVTWDVERDLFGRRPERGAVWADPLSPIRAVTAGRHLAGLAAAHDLTVYESFLPDLVGHGRIDLPSSDVVRRIDEFLGGLLADRSPETSVVMTSDHGNFEDSTVSTHTRAPVPLLVVGPAAPRLANLSSIVEVSAALLGILESAST